MGGGAQIVEVACGGSPHLRCKRDQVKMRDVWKAGYPKLGYLN